MLSIHKLPKAAVIVFGILLAIFCSTMPKSDDYIVDVIYGKPTFFMEETKSPFQSSQQIVDDGRFIYILVDDHKGVVQVYNTNGTYQNSIAFYSHLNGAFRIAVFEETFYVCDKQGSLYLFQNGNFVEFLSYMKAEAFRKSVDFEQNSSKYCIEKGSVWEKIRDGNVCIIERPIFFFQSSGGFLPICVILICPIILFMKNKKFKSYE